MIGWASTISDSSTVSILMATSPIFALVLSHFFTADDRLTWFKVLSVIIGFSGVLILVLPSINLSDTSNLLAKLATLLAAVSYVIAGLLTRKLTEDIGVPSITSIVLIFSTLILAPIAFIEGFSAIDSYSFEVLLSVLFLGVFSTALALLIRYSLILQVGYTFVSYTGFLVPVFGLIFGALLLNEKLILNTYISLLLVLLALTISRLNSKKIRSALANIKAILAKKDK
jgi:drug/metabolite transporter (DMT)-like permease